MMLPPRDGPAQPVGVALRHVVRGDFDLEATFQLLHVARPQEGWIAGLAVYFFMDDEEWNGLWFGKMNERGRGSVFVTGHRTGDRSRGDERVDKFTDAVAAQDGSGIFRLRVDRRGATFRFLAADGETGAVPLPSDARRRPPGRAHPPVRGGSGWSPDAIVDGRLVELTMRAEDFVGYPAHGR